MMKPRRRCRRPPPPRPPPRPPHRPPRGVHLAAPKVLSCNAPRTTECRVWLMEQTLRPSATHRGAQPTKKSVLRPCVKSGHCRHVAVHTCAWICKCHTGCQCDVDGGSSACFEKAYFEGAACDDGSLNCTSVVEGHSKTQNCTLARIIHHLKSSYDKYVNDRGEGRWLSQKTIERAAAKYAGHGSNQTLRIEEGNKFSLQVRHNKKYKITELSPGQQVLDVKNQGTRIITTVLGNQSTCQSDTRCEPCGWAKELDDDDDDDELELLLGDAMSTSATGQENKRNNKPHKNNQNKWARYAQENVDVTAGPVQKTCITEDYFIDKIDYHLPQVDYHANLWLLSSS